MTIGIIDVDRTHFPNIALGKIAAYHRAQGHKVEWADPMFGQYDRIYASKIFNFTPDFTDIYHCDIERGGTGYDLHKQLPEAIDRLQPDYTLYPQIDSHISYGFLTRGCPNQCPWCVVPRKEGAIRPYMDIEEITQGGRRPNAILMDNNILASDYGLKQIEKIIRRGYRVDFNQALDARLITPEIARMLAQVRWINHIRLGCDTPQQISQCERAMHMIDTHCETPKSYIMYTMIGADLEEAYKRLMHFRDNKRVRIAAQPYRDPDNPHQKIPQWQRDMAHWAMRRELWTTCDFRDFQPRKGFTCRQYFQ